MIRPIAIRLQAATQSSIASLRDMQIERWTLIQHSIIAHVVYIVNGLAEVVVVDVPLDAPMGTGVLIAPCLVQRVRV